MTAILTPPPKFDFDKTLAWLKSPTGGLKKQKTTKNMWRKLRDFSGYARDIPQMALMTLRYMSWVNAGNCWIPNKNFSGRLAPMVFNRGQLIILDADLEQAMAGQPIRQIIPKSRRQGVSTLKTTKHRFFCDHWEHKSAKLIAHEEGSTKEIFEIVRMNHAHVLGQRTKKNVSYTNIPKEEIIFEDTQSSFKCFTGMGRGKGRGGKTDFLDLSELAQFDFKTKRDEEALDAVLITVTDGDPNTEIVIESTGKGSAGEFAKRVMAAQMSKDGDEQEKNPYKLVFLPWNIDAMCNDKDAPKSFEEFKKPLAGYEIVLVKDYGCTPSNIMWRRNKLREKGVRDYSENPVNFAHEFPICVEDVLRTQAGRVYPSMNPVHPKMQEFPENYFSKYAYHARAIDVGASEASPFVCLWLVVDPDKPAALVASPTCVNLWEEFQNYVFDPITGEPVKQFDHGMDALRYYIGTIKPHGLVYVRKEMFIRDFQGRNDPQAIIRRIYQESGYYHISGNPEHPDLTQHKPGPGAYQYQVSVVDRAAKSMIQMLNVAKIDAIGYTAPQDKSTGKGLVNDGIALVQALTAGNIIFDPEPEDQTVKLAESAHEKLTLIRPVEPSREEWAAYHERFGGSPEDLEDAESASYQW